MESICADERLALLVALLMRRDVALLKFIKSMSEDICIQLYESSKCFPGIWLRASSTSLGLALEWISRPFLSEIRMWSPSIFIVLKVIVSEVADSVPVSSVLVGPLFNVVVVLDLIEFLNIFSGLLI